MQSSRSATDPPLAATLPTSRCESASRRMRGADRWWRRPGIFGVVSVIVIADLTRGTGRFNLAQGAIATATGIGAALSNALTGVLAKNFGYNAGFLFLAAVAVAAFLFFALAMPETIQKS